MPKKITSLSDEQCWRQERDGGLHPLPIVMGMLRSRELAMLSPQDLPAQWSMGSNGHLSPSWA